MLVGFVFSFKRTQGEDGCGKSPGRSTNHNEDKSTFEAAVTVCTPAKLE